MDTENTGATKKAATKPPNKPRKSANNRSGEEEGSDYQRSEKKLYWVRIFNEWCKSCGICAALCPQKIIIFDARGYPRVEDQDDCTGCRNCEIHCPDFAITIKKRHPERRKSDGRC